MFQSVNEAHFGTEHNFTEEKSSFSSQKACNLGLMKQAKMAYLQYDSMTYISAEKHSLLMIPWKGG